jgi:hypothetical protein
LKALGWLLGVGSVPALSFFIAAAKTQIHKAIQMLISPANRQDSTSVRFGDTAFAKGGQGSEAGSTLSFISQIS